MRAARRNLLSEWAVLLMLAAVGALVLAAGILAGVCTLLVAATGDGATTLDRDSLLVQNTMVGFIMGGLGLVLYWLGLLTSWVAFRMKSEVR